MTKTEMDKFKLVLEAKQADLIDLLALHRGAIAVDKSPDQADETLSSSEREQTIRDITRESSLLKEVRAALRRIDDGSFGICTHCENEDGISPKRLNAVPWARFCIQCQEAADRHKQEGTLEESMMNAA
jgi:DnaK suppressor protein